MKRYSIFHPLVLSFFSGSLYRDVGQRWRGTGLAYLLLALALVWIPTVISAHLGFEKFADHDSRQIVEQIPAITISHGKISTDVTTPYFIKAPDGTPLMIIDTTGKYQTLDDTPAQLLLTKSKLLMRQGTSETRTYDLSGVQSFFVDRARVEGWLGIAKRLFFPVFYPVAVILSFIFRAIQMLIYALIGLLFARMLAVNLNYKVLMRLAAVAITPVLVLDLVLEFVPFHIPLWSLIGLVIGLAYLFFAVKANAESDTPPETASPWARPTVMP